MASFSSASRWEISSTFFIVIDKIHTVLIFFGRCLNLIVCAKFIIQNCHCFNRLLMSYFMDKKDVPKLLEVCEKYVFS